MKLILFLPTIDRLKSSVFVWHANICFWEISRSLSCLQARKCHDNDPYMGIKDCYSKVVVLPFV